MEKKYRLGYGGLAIFALIVPWIIVLIWGIVIFFNSDSYIFPVILTFSLPVPIIALAVFGVLIWANSRWFVKIERDRIILQELIEKHEIALKDISKVTIVNSSYYLAAYKRGGAKGLIPLTSEYRNKLIESFRQKSNEQAINTITEFFDKYSSYKVKLSQGKFFLIETLSRTFAVSPEEYDLFLTELKEKYRTSQNKNLATSEIILRY